MKELVERGWERERERMEVNEVAVSSEVSTWLWPLWEKAEVARGDWLEGEKDLVGRPARGHSLFIGRPHDSISLNIKCSHRETFDSLLYRPPLLNVSKIYPISWKLVFDLIPMRYLILKYSFKGGRRFSWPGAVSVSAIWIIRRFIVPPVPWSFEGA